jgi:hypothetical protein
MRKTTLKWFYAALSLLIVFHLFAVLLAPNSQNYLGSRAAPLINPYISFFEIASQWGFFAPDPGPPPIFVEYELVGAEGNATGSGTWPERKDPYFLRERQNRRIAVTRFAMAGPQRIERTLGPYFCRKHPEAKSVRLWTVVDEIPNLHDVAAGKRKIADGVGTQRKWVGQVLCEKGGA